MEREGKILLIEFFKSAEV